MKKLFDEDDRWTKVGLDSARKFTQVIEEVMKQFAKQGYSVRELSVIAHGCVSEVESKLVLKSGK